MKRIFSAWLLCLLLNTFAAGGEQYRVLLAWTPQAQFAGFYVAEAEGLYRNAGLNVTLLHPRVDENVFASLDSGTADFAIGFLSAAIEHRANGGDIVAVGQIFQKSALMLAARKSAGIQQKTDLTGRRIGLWLPPSIRNPQTAFLRVSGVRDAQILPVAAKADLFLYGGVDAISVMEYNELYSLFAAGIDFDQLALFFVSEAFPELGDDGMYCRAELYRHSPEVGRKLMAATLEGWRRAFAEPEKTLDLVEKICRKNGTPFNRAHQRWMLKTLEKYIQPKTNDGALRRESFRQARLLMNLKREQVLFADFAPEFMPKEAEK